MHSSNNFALPGGPAFISVADAARYLGIGRGLAYKQVKKYIATGGRSGIPAKRVGRRILVPIAGLSRYVDGDEQG
jgi:hypothetical protein